MIPMRRFWVTAVNLACPSVAASATDDQPGITTRAAVPPAGPPGEESP
jgi:hypothetical protein